MCLFGRYFFLVSGPQYAFSQMHFNGTTLKVGLILGRKGQNVYLKNLFTGYDAACMSTFSNAHGLLGLLLPLSPKCITDKCHLYTRSWFLIKHSSAFLVFLISLHIFLILFMQHALYN